MAYLVLARKYRPQTFADMTGQEHVVQTLSNALTSGRVAHALLFCGPRGCGKTTTARIVAKALNCEKGPTPTPCDVCTPCREITAGSDLDVQEIDAASNTGVDNVRELRESAKYLPTRDRFKIFIVDEVHMLSKAAFNAFLKTLEEPPGHVKFLFATTDPQALPDTILSRCQRHNFRLVPLKQIAERIQSIAKAENVSIDDGAVALVARQAAGSMRDALSLLDQVFSSCAPGVPITSTDAAQALGALDRTVVSRLAGALLDRDARGVLEGIAQAYDGGHDLKRLTEDLATHLRNLVAASISGAPLDLPDHEIRTLREQSAKVESVELARLFDIAHGALFEISRASQPRHALEIALLRAIYLAPATSVQTLLARADDLARRIGGGGGTDPLPPGPSGGVRPGGAPPPAGRPRPAAFDGPPAAGGPPFRAATPEARAPEVPAPARPAQPSRLPEMAPAALAVAAPVVRAPEQPPAKPAPQGDPWARHLHIVPREEPPERTAQPPPPASPVAPPAPSLVRIAEGAAAVSSPAVPLPAPDAELQERWPRLVEGVRQQKKMLGSFLEHARPLTLEGGELSLGFLKGEIFSQKVTADRATLEALLSELLRTPTRVKIVEFSASERTAVASLAETTDKAQREARDARLKQGREHPAVLRAIQALGAEIEEVRDLGGAGS